MATKKQKRLLGEARAAQHREESRLSGLKAQKRDRERREKKAKEAKREEARANASRDIKHMASAGAQS